MKTTRKSKLLLLFIFKRQAKWVKKEDVAESVNDSQLVNNFYQHKICYSFLLSALSVLSVFPSFPFVLPSFLLSFAQSL